MTGVLPSRDDARRWMLTCCSCCATGPGPRGRPTTRSRARACSTTSASTRRRCRRRAGAADAGARRRRPTWSPRAPISSGSARPPRPTISPTRAIACAGSIRRSSDRASARSMSSGSARRCIFEGAFGAAATVFDSVTARAATRWRRRARERVLDWWASAIDREARPRPDIERQRIYQRIRDAHGRGARDASRQRRRRVLDRGRGRGAGRSAGGMGRRAGRLGARAARQRKGVALRADLDRLVLRAIVPDRARQRASRPNWCAPNGSGSRRAGRIRRVPVLGTDAYTFHRLVCRSCWRFCCRRRHRPRNRVRSDCRWVIRHPSE